MYTVAATYNEREMMMNKPTFEAWQSRVNAIIEAQTGLGIDDIDDYDYWSAWDAGDSPSLVAADAMHNAGWR